jgi:hypothetical protein
MGEIRYLDRRDVLLKRLQETIESVRTGKTIGLVIVEQWATDETTSWWEITTHPKAGTTALLGALGDAQHRLARAREDDSREDDDDDEPDSHSA